MRGLDLTDLGFDGWFRDQLGDLNLNDRGIARVSAVDRDSYRVRNQETEVPAELSGRLRFSAESSLDLPAVGDWVVVQYYDSAAVIHDLLRRKTLLARKTSGKNVDHQVIAANIDSAFIVQSCHFDFNVRRLDRYLVMVRDGNIEPKLLLTKTDLVSPEELNNQILAIKKNAPDVELLMLSNKTGDGFANFKNLLLAGRTYCLLGSSGVGKTTLINRLTADDVLETKPVSSTGEGVHTTTRRQLVLLPDGAMLIDTPGMRELGLLGTSEGIDQSFEDIAGLARSCRYADCSHTKEPRCAVRAAVASGELSEARLASYMKLTKESQYYALSYEEKRRKDRAFGRFIKVVKKSLKK